MPLFSYKKNRIIPALPPSATRRHNLYSEYNRLVPSPPPSFIAHNHEPYYSDKSLKRYKEIEDVEKYNHHKKMHTDILKDESISKISCSRVTCCVCFPCLPMWTRTICCFIFLAICCIIGLVVIFVLTFKKPQVTFNGNGRSSLSEDFQFEYSISNNNFFEIDFDKIKAVIYYPLPNKTTVGVAEIHNLKLGPQTTTNVTFPVQMISNGYNKNEPDWTEEKSVGEKDFRDMVIDSCNRDNNITKSDNKKTSKEIVILFDLMPTIRIYNYPIVTLAFTGQKTKISCDKFKFLTEDEEK